MERKTIGGFLAALRKANGMTQKELAEKLNVSDKTVSRIVYQEHDGSLLPITVYTHHDIRMGQLRFQVIQTGFAVLYCLEAAAALAVYFAKRAKA